VGPFGRNARIYGEETIELVGKCTRAMDSIREYALYTLKELSSIPT
jgi:hypothetical protein